ncbi:MAG TPA: hypothetical protein VF042_15295 [Gemmatimonadaceae bacterium]
MTDELRFPANGDRDSLDESLVSLMREAYSPPGGEAYWSGLESKIMSRVRSQAPVDSAWWNVLAPWARPALIAAAAIFALAGAINQQLHESEEQVAYDSLVQSVKPDVMTTTEELSSVERGADGATLSYFLSH